MDSVTSKIWNMNPLSRSTGEVGGTAFLDRLISS